MKLFTFFRIQFAIASCCLFASVCVPNGLHAQELVNGSFESDSVPDCNQGYLGFFQHELLNEHFEGLHSHTTLSLLNICSDTGYYIASGQPWHPYGVYDGFRTIQLIGDSVQGQLFISGFSFELTNRLKKDTLYNLSFYKRKMEELWAPTENTFREPSDFAVGLSNDSTQFGNEIYYAEKAETVEWQHDSFSFIPDSNYKFITVQTRLGDTYGRKNVFLDHFVLTKPTDVNEPKIREFSISPTLVENDIQIAVLESVIQNKSVIIYNSVGSIISTALIPSNSFTMDLSFLDAGMYIVTIEGYKPRRIVKN